MMAQIFIVGRIKRAGQMIAGKDGGKSFLAATVEVVRSSGGRDFTDYYSVNCYSKDSESLVPALVEGVMVVAQGIPGINTYQSKDGKTKANMKIIGQITPLTGKPKPAEAASGEYDPERPPI